VSRWTAYPEDTMNNFKQLKSFFLILFVALLGSGVGVLAKVGLKEISPLSFTFWRFLSALAILLPIFYFQKNRLKFNSFKKLFWVLLFAAGNIFIFIFGIQLTTASSSQIIYTFSPLIAGILSFFVLGEKLGARKIIGVILGFLGTLLIVLLPVLTGSSTINGSLLGNLLILLAVTSHSIYTVLSKNIQKEFSPIVITTYSALFTLLISLIFLPLDTSSFFQMPSAGGIFSILYSGIAGTALFYLLYQYAIKNTSPMVASTVLYLQPIFTFIWAIALLGEKITAGLIIGMCFVFSGVFLATVSKSKEKIINK